MEKFQARAQPIPTVLSLGFVDWLELSTVQVAPLGPVSMHKKTLKKINILDFL